MSEMRDHYGESRESSPVSWLANLGKFRYNAIYKGKIEQRIDPTLLGRLRVRVVGIHADDIPVDQLPWASPCSPSWGKGGVLWVPPLGEYTWVLFEDGHVEYPVWIGGWWSHSDVGRGESEQGSHACSQSNSPFKGTQAMDGGKDPANPDQAAIDPTTGEATHRNVRLTYYTRFDDGPAYFQGQTSTGVRAREGTTVAVSHPGRGGFPVGTVFNIPQLVGLGGSDGTFIAQDVGGGVGPNQVDVYVEADSPESAAAAIRAAQQRYGESADVIASGANVQGGQTPEQQAAACQAQTYQDQLIHKTKAFGGKKWTSGPLVAEDFQGVNPEDAPNNYVQRSPLGKHSEFDDRRGIQKVKIADQLDNMLWINTEMAVATWETSRGLKKAKGAGKFRGLTMDCDAEVMQMYTFEKWFFTSDDKHKWWEWSSPLNYRIRMDETAERIEIWTKGGHKMLFDDKKKSIICKSTGGHWIMLDDQGQSVQVSHVNGSQMVMSGGAGDFGAGGVRLDVYTPGKLTIHSVQELGIKSNKSIDFEAPTVTLNGYISGLEPKQPPQPVAPPVVKAAKRAQSANEEGAAAEENSEDSGEGGGADPGDTGDGVTPTEDELAKAAEKDAGAYGGPMGCAASVNRVLAQNGYETIDGASTASMYDNLVGNPNWEEVDFSSAGPGSIIIAPTRGGTVGHVGIMGSNGLVWSNTSSRGHTWYPSQTPSSFQNWFNGRGLTTHAFRPRQGGGG